MLAELIVSGVIPGAVSYVFSIKNVPDYVKILSFFLPLIGIMAYCLFFEKSLVVMALAAAVYTISFFLWCVGAEVNGNEE